MFPLIYLSQSVLRSWSRQLFLHTILRAVLQTKIGCGTHERTGSLPWPSVWSQGHEERILLILEMGRGGERAES